MLQYKAYLSGFCATTKLIDYIHYTNIDSIDGANELPLKEFTKLQYQKLMAKLKWEQFAEEFDIPSLTAVIDSVLSGSLIITWLVPPDLADKIVVSVHKSTAFFQKHHITYVAVDDKPLYDTILEVIMSFQFVYNNHRACFQQSSNTSI